MNIPNLASTADLLDGAVSYLTHLHDSLALIPDPAYTHVSAALPGSTIGKHVRHILDHFSLFLAAAAAAADPAVEAPCISYSHRERSPGTETFVKEGQRAIMNMVARLRSLKNGHMPQPDSPVTIEDTLPPSASHQKEGDSAFVSSWARELWFCTHHMIHHNAIIACLMHEAGLHPPKEFAYAPSTLKRSSTTHNTNSDH
ncbi:hypothetical protein EV175_001077 [Coemansia sp. RSA 1933]|nr:hypothetical protein EV175_001077 [Coemansia sp. RSA 1933]